MRKTPMTNGTRRMGDEGGRTIRRLWGDVEVIDAKNDLRVFITEDDVKRATPKDPMLCVFARACMRTFRATKILFWRTVAYVELPDQDGKHHVERFIMPDRMRDLIEAFDRGEGVVPEAGFVLRAPGPSQTLDGEMKRSANQRASERRKLLGRRDGEPGIGQGKGKYRDGSRVVDASVRNGTGAVHFTVER